MAIFNFRKKKIKNKADSSTISPEVDDVLLQALLNNEPITREKAMTIPAVSSAVDFISSTVASMSVKLYHYKAGKTEKDDEGNPMRKPGRVEEVERDSRVRLLNTDTGDTLNAYQLKKAMVEDYLLGKGGFAYINRNRNDVTGLYYVKDESVAPYRSSDPIFKEVRFQIGTNIYRRWEILKLLRNTKYGDRGRPLTDEVSKALQTAYATMLYQLGLAKSGGSKKGFLKSERKLDQATIDKLKEAWRKLYEQNEENVVVLNNGLDFKEASATSAEMQLDQNKKTLTDEINSIFHIYADFDRTFKEAIYPIIKAFENELNSTLLLESEKKNYFFEFDVKEILRVNIKERYEAYEKAIKSGWKTINEVRREENMNAIPGMDILNLGLSSVVYDTNTHEWYVPNTGLKTKTEKVIDENGNIVEETEIDETTEEDEGADNGSENADKDNGKGNDNEKA